MMRRNAAEQSVRDSHKVILLHAGVIALGGIIPGGFQSACLVVGFLSQSNR